MPGSVGPGQEQGPGPGPEQGPRGLSPEQKKIRGEVIEASDLEALLQRYAATNPALIPIGALSEVPGAEADGEADDEPSADLDTEEAEEEDEIGDLLGEGGESYEFDPEANFTETEAPEPSGTTRQPCVVIAVDGGPLEVELGPLPAWTLRPDLARSVAWRRARWILRCVGERGALLLRVGELVAREQAAFFSASPGAALAKLKPMSREAVAKAVGVDATAIGRLAKSGTVDTPLGVVRLSIFVGGARGGQSRGGRDTVRDDALAQHVARIQATARKKVAAPEILRRLVREGVIDQPRGADEIEAARRRISRASARLRLPHE